MTDIPPEGYAFHADKSHPGVPEHNKGDQKDFKIVEPEECTFTHACIVTHTRARADTEQRLKDNLFACIFKYSCARMRMHACSVNLWTRRDKEQSIEVKRTGGREAVREIRMGGGRKETILLQCGGWW